MVSFALNVLEQEIHDAIFLARIHNSTIYLLVKYGNKIQYFEVLNYDLVKYKQFKDVTLSSWKIYFLTFCRPDSID